MTDPSRRMFCFRLLPAALLALAAPAGAAADGFPVTVTHALGQTTIAGRPQRIVSLGYNDHDFLYALDIPPVGVTEWWGGQPYATWPWAEPQRLATGAAPNVTRGSIDLEWVLVQNPDLIVATYRDLDEKSYRQLSRIAPVIARPSGFPAWSAPWETQLRLLDMAASGSNTKADAIIAALDARFAAIRARYPQFAGRSASMADMREGQFTLWGRETGPTRFLARLGFMLPDALNIRADPSGWIYLSFEQTALIDLDVVLWPNGQRDEIEAMPVYRNLRLFRDGRSVWPAANGAALSAALWFQTPLSIDFALEQLAPRLAAALDGDPTTSE